MHHTQYLIIVYLRHYFIFRTPFDESSGSPLFPPLLPHGAIFYPVHKSMLPVYNMIETNKSLFLVLFLNDT